MPSRKKTYSQAQAGVKYGWRSGLEEEIAGQLRTQGVEYLYEEVPIPFVQPVKPRKYTPDFILPNGIILETKGRFVTADRAKHLLVKAQHPHLDIRFIFSYSRTRISKQSITTYGAWCESKGFLYTDKQVPPAWAAEPGNKVSQKAILLLLREIDDERMQRVAEMFKRYNSGRSN